MTLTVKLGDSVTARIDGQGAQGPGQIPAGSKVSLDSSTPAVATVDPIPDLPADTASLSVPVTVLAEGSTDFNLRVETPSQTAFEAKATLVVQAIGGGLVAVTLTLTSP